MDAFECNQCRGSGHIITRQIALYDPCSKCKGMGRLDWIENARGTRHSTELTENDYWKTTDYNIHLLSRELQDMCLRFNIQAIIDFKKMENPMYSAANPIIIPKGGFGGI